MKPGDIVLIRFPRADLLEGKLRPALTLAVAPGNHPDILLALITSREYQAVPEFDEILDPAEIDFALTGLKTRSVIRLARLASVESSVISARLGSISPERVQTIKSRLIKWLQENPPTK
jgi:mRNA interferase MazF